MEKSNSQFSPLPAALPACRSAHGKGRSGRTHLPASQSQHRWPLSRWPSWSHCRSPWCSSTPGPQMQSSYLAVSASNNLKCRMEATIHYMIHSRWHFHFLFNYKVRWHTLSLCISVRPSYLVLHSSTQVRETEKERSDCIFNNTIPVVLHLYMYNHIMISSGAYDPGLKVTDCMTAWGR